MIKEIPILFSTAMVLAELEKRKTMTRRTTDLESINESPDNWVFIKLEDNAKGGLNAVFKRKDSLLHKSIPCRYGRPKDLLWVRENWQLKGWDFEEGTMKVRYATGETLNCLAHDPSEDSEWLMNQVDRLEKGGYIVATSSERFEFTNKKQPFKPSIHMPKEAARIWLQVTDVRVERLQDITEEDAVAEGIEKRPGSTNSTRFDYRHYGYGTYDVSAQVSFRTLWEKINGPDSWQANPWIWAVSFTVLSTTGKPSLITT